MVGGGGEGGVPCNAICVAWNSVGEVLLFSEDEHHTLKQVLLARTISINYNYCGEGCEDSRRVEIVMSCLDVMFCHFFQDLKRKIGGFFFPGLEGKLSVVYFFRDLENKIRRVFFFFQGWKNKISRVFLF